MDDIALTLVSVPNPVPSAGHFNRALLGIFSRAPRLADLRELILQAREGVARAVDSGLTALYWHIGQRIRQDVLKEKRAEYGAQIVAALGRQLETEFGCGFGEKNLRRMIRFAEVLTLKAAHLRPRHG